MRAPQRSLGLGLTGLLATLGMMTGMAVGVGVMAGCTPHGDDVTPYHPPGTGSDGPAPGSRREKDTPVPQPFPRDPGTPATPPR